MSPPSLQITPSAMYINCPRWRLSASRCTSTPYNSQTLRTSHILHISHTLHISHIQSPIWDLCNSLKPELWSLSPCSYDDNAAIAREVSGSSAFRTRWQDPNLQLHSNWQKAQKGSWGQRWDRYQGTRSNLRERYRLSPQSQLHRWKGWENREGVAQRRGGRH